MTDPNQELAGKAPNARQLAARGSSMSNMEAIMAAARSAASMSMRAPMSDMDRQPAGPADAAP